MRGRVALVLAMGVSTFVVSLGIVLIWATIDRSQNVTETTGNLVAAVVGGIVGALAVYLGGETGGNHADGGATQLPPEDQNLDDPAADRP